MPARIDGRMADALRPVRITPGYLRFAEGSALIELGQTQVLCAASVEERVPPFLKGTGRGWVTAEYAMLPRSTSTRTRRDGVEGHVSGRSQEIQRLIGRSLRAVTDLGAFGERTITLDCDVIQADGGTRTAAITGAYVALQQAIDGLARKKQLKRPFLQAAVAATSAGIVDGAILLDLCYEEDSHAQVDFNVVMTDQQRFVEVQGTAEHAPFSQENMDAMLALAARGINRLFEVQHEVLAGLGIATPEHRARDGA